MQLHDVRKAKLSHRRRMRVGRGPASGKGKTCGRGLKGATARSGWSMKVTYEGGQMPFFRRLPKRGFNNARFRTVYAEINVSALARFDSGSTVTRKVLDEAGLLRGRERLPLKILGDGKLQAALTVEAEAFSKGAKVKIEAAGGKVVWTKGEPKKAAPDFVRLAKEKKLAEARKKAKGAKPTKVEKGAKKQPTAGTPKKGGVKGSKKGGKKK